MTAPHDEGMTPSRDDPVTTPPPPRSTSPVLAIGTILSAVMILLGAFVLGRLIMRPDDPMMPSPMLDIAFGVFFIGRGAVQYWSVRRRMRG